MKVMEIIDLSTTDWPGKAATVIFFEGCPLACPRCHNRKFEGEVREMTRQHLSTTLKENSKVMDAVVFSGGEALTYTRDLIKLGKEAQSYGLLVGLETSGIYPDKLKLMLEAGAIDRVFLDMKGPLFDGPVLQKRTGNTYQDVSFAVAQSLTHILGFGVPLELRATVFPDYPNEEEILKTFRDIGSIFKINKKTLDYRLLRGLPIDGDFEPLSVGDLTGMAKRIEAKLWEMQATVAVGAR